LEAIERKELILIFAFLLLPMKVVIVAMIALRYYLCESISCIGCMSGMVILDTYTSQLIWLIPSMLIKKQDCRRSAGVKVITICPCEEMLEIRLPT